MQSLPILQSSPMVTFSWMTVLSPITVRRPTLEKAPSQTRFPNFVEQCQLARRLRWRFAFLDLSLTYFSSSVTAE